MLFNSPLLTEQDEQVIARIDRIREALRHQLPDQRRWVGLLRRVMLARAIRGSNSIEGYNVSLDDAAAAIAGEEPLDATDEAWMAVVGYRDAMTSVLQLADDAHFTYDESLIRSLHYMMIGYALDKSPGRWRPGPVYVHDESTGDIVFTGPDAIDVPDLMHELVEYLRNRDRELRSLGFILRGDSGHWRSPWAQPMTSTVAAGCWPRQLLTWAARSSPPFALCLRCQV